MKRLNLPELASSLLDDTIEKGQKLEERDLLKAKQHRDDLKKGLSHNPFKPHDMTHESPFYNPYKMDETGSGWMPHEAESWYEMGKNREKDNYLTVNQFYGKQVQYDQTVNRFAELRRSLEPDLIKALPAPAAKPAAKPSSGAAQGGKAPIGTIHTYKDGQRYKKFAEGDWRPLAGLETGDMRDRLQHPKFNKNANDTLEMHHSETQKMHKDIEDHASKTKTIQEALDKKKKEEDLKSSVRKEALGSLKTVLEKMHGGKLPPEVEQHFADNTTHLDPKLAEKVKRKEPGKGHEISLTKQDVTSLLKSGKYALISAGKNPADKEDSNLSDVEIGQRYEDLRGELKQAGYAFTKVTGHYGGEEDSYLVMIHDHDDKHIMELGKKFKQDSVIVGDGGRQKMIFTTGKNAGKAHEGEGFQEVGDDQEDFYSELKTSDGQIMKFALNFDFDKLSDAEVQDKSKSSTKGSEKPTSDKPSAMRTTNTGHKTKKVGVSMDDVMNAYKSFVNGVESDWLEENGLEGDDLIKGAAVPIGTVHTYRDGLKYKKVSEGVWQPVTDPKAKTAQVEKVSPGKKQDHLEKVEAVLADKLDKKKPEQPKKKKSDKVGTPKDAGKPDNDMGPPPAENEAFVKPGSELKLEEVSKFIDAFKKDYVGLQVLSYDLKKAGADHFANRLKDKVSLYNKMHGRLADRSLNTATDVIGSRALASDAKKQQSVIKHIKDNYEIVELDDFSKKGRPDGYRAIHCLFKTESGKITELQVKTHLQQIYSGFTHDTVYKPSDALKDDMMKDKDGRPKNREVAQYLNDLSDYLSDLDKGGEDIKEKRPVEPEILKINNIVFPWAEIEKIGKGDLSSFDGEEKEHKKKLKKFEAQERGKVKHFVVMRNDKNENMEIKEFDTFEQAEKHIKKHEKTHKGQMPTGYSDSKDEFLKVFSEYRPHGWDGDKNEKT